ncbi:MAG TPA: sensor histidine kinase [Lachnospiraceae bacterium]|nr:sensor histidine kinase [Lachnospiraceae bacterium]
MISRMSLKAKLNTFCYIILIPLAIIIVYLLFSIVTFCNSYNQIVKNITAMNAYNINFKDEIDLTMYKIVIGSVSFDSLDEKTEIKNPQVLYDEAREAFKKQYEITTVESNKKRIQRIIKGLDIIEDRTADIKNNIEEKGHYDDNIFLLEKSIYILTELMQEQIQEYVYYETANLENTRVELELKEKEALRISLISFAVVLFGTGILSVAISNGLSRPIKNLSKTTELVANGDFSVRADIGSGHEVATLARSFNSMIAKIGELVEDIRVEQFNLKVTELKLLQAQINPHFLYNTLDTIIWLAEDKKTKEVVNMVTSLSDFFRTTLSEGKDYITIREEEEHVRSYLEIQQVRYRDILDFEIDIPASIYQFKILKITLQPLVENALYHGIKNKRGKGMIKVKGEIAENVIYLHVEDNGIGMKEEDLCKLQNHVRKRNNANREEGGFGLANVDERIRLNYGSSFGLSFASTFGEGMEVTVRIPAVLCVVNED